MLPFVLQGIRWKGFNTWNHAAIVVSNETGRVKCVQMAWRCERVRLEDVAPTVSTSSSVRPAVLTPVNAPC